MRREIIGESLAHGENQGVQPVRAKTVICLPIFLSARAESATSTTFDVAMPSHRRELQTTVSNTAELQSALANTAVGHIELAFGSYLLNAQLSITRSVVLEAAVGGSVVLNAQASSSSPRRVLYIAPGSSGVVQLIGLSSLSPRAKIRQSAALTVSAFTIKAVLGLSAWRQLPQLDHQRVPDTGCDHLYVMRLLRMEQDAIAALQAVLDLLCAISRPGDELAAHARGRRGQKDGEREDRAAVAVAETHQAAAGGVGVEFDTANAKLGRRHSRLWKVFLRSHGVEEFLVQLRMIALKVKAAMKEKLAMRIALSHIVHSRLTSQCPTHHPVLSGRVRWPGSEQ